MTRYLLTLALALALWSTAPLAQPIQSLESITEAVETFLLDETAHSASEVVVEVGRIDSRLRLSQCELPLEAYWPDAARRVGNVAVGVRCESPSSWSLFVRARLELREEVLVSSRPLSRGARLTAEDMELVSQDISRLNQGYFTEPQALIGSVLTRPIRAGTVYTPALAKAASVIKRGQRVSILAQSEHIQVRMEGEALSDGAVGDVIRVRNLSSRQEVEAVVVGPGLVQVRM